ncbi:MAG: hypothetical protein Q9220_002444 [cf. Caloplaca sp. 1 TL-2023]
MSSGVGWQVDLPGLSSLVLNAGAAGLKKFAQAGVDVHTLLCMGEIAETCPASPEYRKEINTCRQQQRRQSIWLFKVVEIGTASNFIADELLKKRAGENVVALMSTVIPILPEHDCDSFLLQLFESSRIDADKTPGFGQLQAFRDALQPLASKTAFKDRAYQYHAMLGRLAPEYRQELTGAVPSTEALAKLVLLFQSLVQRNPSHVLSYRGRVGAAWAIAYARHVLGLRVCVLRTLNDPVPINGDFQDSRVRVYVNEQEPVCEIASRGQVSELISITSQPYPPAWSWIIDLENVNLADVCLPYGPTRLAIISDMTRILMNLLLGHYYTDALRTQHYSRRFRCLPVGLQSYASYCLPEIKSRALKVLIMMGLCTNAHVEPTIEKWKDYLCIQAMLGAQDRFFIDFVPGPKWTHLQSGDYKSSPETKWGTGRRLIIHGLLQIADAACWLASSNWTADLHCITAEFFQDLREPRQFQLTRDEEAWEVASGRLGDIVAGRRSLARLGADLDLQADQPIAVESQGIVYAQSSAFQYCLGSEALFVRMYRGTITLMGETRPYISGSLRRDRSDGIPVSKAALERNVLNAVPSLEITTESRLRRECIGITAWVVLERRISLVKASQD